LQGYDSIFCAGTGYSKSLVFEALAILGGLKKLALVVSPLKVLERDQVCELLLLSNAITVNDILQAEQAMEKGINVIVIKEDTMKSTDLWKSARISSSMVYMSPEMVLSNSFSKLWKDSQFRTRLTEVIVDEAHCIDEWGGEDFTIPPARTPVCLHWPGGSNHVLHSNGDHLNVQHYLENVGVREQAFLGS
jgi:superfamily II DNA helicase RecQ